MPLALYTIKGSNASAIFVIFICSLWPMLINTAFGVASVRREWLNVAKTLEVKPMRRALRVILPAAAPTIMTGIRISIITIDFHMTLERQPDPKGDRVKITMSGKYLQYKGY